MSNLSAIRSQLNNAVSSSSPGGETITAKELKGLKAKAATGTIALLDINSIRAEVEGESNSTARDNKLAALEEMRGVAAKSAQVQSDGIWGALSTIDKLNPFAYIRWGLGGTKPGG